LGFLLPGNHSRLWLSCLWSLCVSCSQVTTADFGCPV
jgi:hypothetical protein